MQAHDAITYIGQGRHTDMSPEALLRGMDQAGIECAAVAAADRFLAVANRDGNDLALAAARAYPGRLLVLAVANPWFEKAAEAELRRAFKAGARGMILHPLYHGVRISDPINRPLLEIAAEFKAVVYVPTGLPMIGEPFQLVECARRFPDLNFVMGHAGASDYYADAVGALSFAANIWLETSRNGAANYQLFELKGLAGRMIFGSSAPEYVPEVEIRILRESLRDQPVLDDILRLNFEKIFKLRGKS